MPKRKYELILPSVVLKQDLKFLSPLVEKRVDKALGLIQEHPELAKRLSGKFSKVYSYRFGTPEGEYRIAFMIEGEKLVVLVVKPRRDVYQELGKRI